MKWSIAIGAILFASGFYLTGTATSLAQLYIYYGLIAGLGQGFAYSGCLSNTLRLFPDKRGLASGIITGGMGLAAVFASPIANSLILSHDAQYAFSDNWSSLYCHRSCGKCLCPKKHLQDISLTVGIHRLRQRKM